MPTTTLKRCNDFPLDRFVYEVPCLAGADVNRYRSEILVEIMPPSGWLAEATTGEVLINLGETKLVGWGDLDGPAVVVTIDGAGWRHAIPRRYYNALAVVE